MKITSCFKSAFVVLAFIAGSASCAAETAAGAPIRIAMIEGMSGPFANAGDAEKRVAMQWATRTNEAYRTLRDPLKRATYLLSLRGVDVGAENNTAMEPAFLMQQMEWRERIEDAAAAKNVGELDALLAELRDEERMRFTKLGALLDSAADQAASEAVRQLMFIERVAAETGAQIEKLED